MSIGTRIYWAVIGLIGFAAGVLGAMVWWFWGAARYMHQTKGIHDWAGLAVSALILSGLVGGFEMLRLAVVSRTHKG